MVDINLLTSGTPDRKPWFTLVSKSLTTDVLIANTVEFKTIEAKSLTLIEQKSVPNPTAGSQTVYIDSDTGMLTTQDSGGATVPYVPITGAQMVGNIDMNANSVQHVLLLSGATNSRTGDSIVSGPATSVAGNLPAFSNTTGVVLVDSGVAPSSLLPKAGGTMTGDLDMGTHDVANVSFLNAKLVDALVTGPAGTATADHIATFIDASGVTLQDSGVNVNNLLPKAGGTMTGAITLQDGTQAQGTKASMQHLDGNAVDNTVVETTLFSGTNFIGNRVYAANSLAGGSVVRFNAMLDLSLGSGTALFNLKIDSGTLLGYTFAPVAPFAGKLSMEMLVCIATDTNTYCHGRVFIEGAGADSAFSGGNHWDFTLSRTLDFTVTFSIADPGNSTNLNHVFLENVR